MAALTMDLIATCCECSVCYWRYNCNILSGGKRLRLLTPLGQRHFKSRTPLNVWLRPRVQRTSFQDPPIRRFLAAASARSRAVLIVNDKLRACIFFSDHVLRTNHCLKSLPSSPTPHSIRHLQLQLHLPNFLIEDPLFSCVYTP